MRTISRSWVTLLGLLGTVVLLVVPEGQHTFCAEVSQEAAGESDDKELFAGPDLAGWLGQHDLVYRQKPVIWDAGFHLANGDLGAVVWFTETEIIVSLDKRDIDETFGPPHQPPPEYSWQRFVERMDAGDSDGGNAVLSSTGQNLLHPPVGRVRVDLGAPIKAFTGRFAVWPAEGSARFEVGGQVAQLFCFVPPGRNVAVLALEFEGSSPDVHLTPEPQSRAAIEGYPKAEVWHTENATGWRQPQLNGREFHVHGHVNRCSDSHVDIFVAMASSLEDPTTPPGERISKVIEQSGQDGVGKLRENHHRWWRQYWRRSFLSLPDPQMETLYYLGMYHLGATANRHKHWPMGLQSPWAPDDHLAVGAGNTHFDLPMYYWPCYTGNQLDAVDAYCDWGLEVLPKMQRRGENIGWKVGDEAGAMLGLCVGPDGTAVLGGTHATSWAGNGAWLAYAYWRRYLYTLDEQFLLERAYPMMRACMTSYLAILRREQDGRLHVPWSCSPEFGAPDNSWGPDGTADLALIRFLTTSLIETVETLHLQDPALPAWKEVLADLTPFPSGPSGLHVWRGRSYDHQHRHLTHMFPFYPLNQMSIEGGPQEQAVIDQTLVTFLKHQNYFPHGDLWPNWSDLYLAAVYARLGRGDACLERLKNYEKYVTPVGLSSNFEYRPGEASRNMVLEASLGYAGVIHDMLLQSWGGTIRVFPAVPSSWQDASFRNLRGEGAFLVSSRLEGGKPALLVVESLAGARCRVANPYHPGDLKLCCWSTGDLQNLSGETVEFETSTGEKYLLLSAESDCSGGRTGLYLPDRPEDSSQPDGWPLPTRATASE